MSHQEHCNYHPGVEICTCRKEVQNPHAAKCQLRMNGELTCICAVASGELACNCKESSCTDTCTRNHTHKDFSCEICAPASEDTGS